MTSLPVNPECCFCDNTYLDNPIRKKAIPSECHNLYFFQYNKNCRSCTFNLATSKTTKGCLKCFSSKHDTAHCENDCGYFFPDIDADLIPRFYSMLDESEKYIFAFSFKEAFKFVQLKHLIVSENMKLFGLSFYIPTLDGSNILVTEKFEIYQLDHTSKVTKILYNNLFTSLSTKTLIIKAKFVYLKKLQISTDDFYLILSPKTVKLRLYEIQFTPGIQFSNILKTLPNVENVEVLYTNIEYDNLWTENLNICKKLEKFELPYESLKIALEKIETLLKNQKRIVLDVNEIDKILGQRLSKFIIKTEGEILYASKIVA